jgi:hypothetical protein
LLDSCAKLRLLCGLLLHRALYLVQLTGTSV